MSEFIPETEITIDAARIIAQGMMKLSACDGVDPSETAMIEAFLADCYEQVGGGESYEALLTQQIDMGEALQVLDNTEMRELFMRSMLLLACADGIYSSEEQALLADYAESLSVATPRLEELSLEVRTHVLEQFAESAVFLDQVEHRGRQLGVPDEVVERILSARATALQAGT